jgi:hypothetical protein
MKLKLSCVISRPITFFCLAVLCGCAGRAQSHLSYTPPESTTEIQRTALLPCDITQARLVVTRYFNTAFSTQPASGTTLSEVAFKLVMPEEELQNALDCGRLGVLNPSSDSSKWGVYERRLTPSAGETPTVFAAAAPRSDFLLADGSSTPKPANLRTKAKLAITISLRPVEKGKTLLELRTAYVVDFDLRRYVLVAGLSPMAPERVSARSQDEAQVVFDAGYTGVLSKPLFGQYYSNGAWPIECRSTGAFEKKIINEIIASISQKGSS